MASRHTRSTRALCKTLISAALTARRVGKLAHLAELLLAADDQRQAFVGDIDSGCVHGSVSPRLSCANIVPGSPTLHPGLPTLCMQAHGHRPRPRILFGMGEEGGEPIYTQALNTTSRLQGPTASRALFINSVYHSSLSIPENRTYKGPLCGPSRAGRTYDQGLSIDDPV